MLSQISIARVIHEGGLTASSLSESQQIHSLYSLRPVLATEGRTSGDLDLLLTTNGQLLDLQASALYSPVTKNMALLFKVFALDYDAGAMLYHCRNLAGAYYDVVTKFDRIRSIPGYAESESGFVSFGHQAEVYYEFDALLSTGRRVYDKIAHCLWQAFEGRGGMPRNMAKFLEQTPKCPQPLAARLQASWTDFGEKLKNYRDCTQHFVSTDPGLTYMTMKRLADGVWIAWARIPDNPEAKAKKEFSYASNHDALTYGWEVANEVISLAGEALTAVHDLSAKDPNCFPPFRSVAPQE